MANTVNWAGPAGFLAAMVLPPAGAAQMAPQWVAEHQVGFLALLALYGTLLSGVTFFAKVAGDLRERWRCRLVDRIDAALGRRVSRFDSVYRELVRTSLRFVDQGGLALIGSYTPELDEVFVDLSLAPRPPHKVSSGLLTGLPAEVSERHAIGDFLDHQEPALLAIIGQAGSGKTTLLRHTASEVCRRRHDSRRTVPILLSLRDHVGAIVADPAATLADLVRAKLGEHRTEEPDGWIERRLRGGECVVLLDGLDEVADLDARRRVSDWVRRQITQQPRNDYVVTSRPHGYRNARIDGATVLQVRRFTEQQVVRFVHGWCRAVERHGVGEDGEAADLRADTAADDLLERLRSNPALYELTANPLLVTMIANVHRFCGALPGTRAELYGEICQAMLWRRQEVKKLPSELGGERKELLLRGLAFAMMRRRVRDLPKADVLQMISPALRRVDRELSAGDFLADATASGLLLERENGLYAFAHQTFQEYLAAAHVRDKRQLEMLTSAVDDPWWRETTLLYAARADADPIIRACLSSDNVTALALAFDCADQAGEVDPQLREELDVLLESAFQRGTSRNRRRLMAGVMVTRQLRHASSSGAAGWLCARPVSTGIYWLFLQDTHHHPPDMCHVEADSAEPVVGVRGREAVAFAHWVNTITCGEWEYRLPSSAELDDPAAQRALTTSRAGRRNELSVWLNPEASDRDPVLWTHERTHPHAVCGDVLAAHLAEDFEGVRCTLARLLLLRSVVVLRASGRDCAADRDLALARHLANDFGNDFSLARDLGLTQERDHKRDRDFVFALAHDFGRARAMALTRDRDRERNLALADDLTRDLTRALERAQAPGGGAVGHAAVLERAIGVDLSLELAAAANGDVQGDLKGDLRVVLGNALSASLTQALRASRPNRPGDWCRFPTELTRSFIGSAGIEGADQRVAPDALADKVRRGRGALAERRDRAGSRWAAEVARRLETISTPVFTRKEPVTGAAAAAIRIAALCLAAEADAGGDRASGDAFREVAAGITLLQRRADGQAQPSETILLVAR